MNTTGIQNYLSNVFRPIVFYDTTTSQFIPKLELSNIDNISGNTVTVFTAAVGDAACNVYVGKEAGNAFDVTRGASNVTAVGYGAGSNISNVSNSVYVGTRAGAGNTSVRDVVALGYEAGRGQGGSSNIFIGSGTGVRLAGTIGASNVFIGHGITSTSAVSNQIRIGLNANTPIVANLLTNWVGLAGSLSPLDVGNKLDVSGNVRIQGQLGINITPGGRTLDVNGNFRAQDSSTNVLDFSNGLTRSSGGFSSLQGSVLVPNATNVSLGANTLKNGLIMIAVASGTANFDGRTVFALDSATVSNLSSNKSATTTVNFTPSNINISNTTGGDLTYKWTITYFPLP
jgi:hypothetical protein